jgi:sec-independent protein translocase protein TatC
MALVPFPDQGPTRRDDDDDEPVESSGARMSFLEHLEELRRRIIVCMVALAVGFGVSFFFIDRIFAFIMRPLQQVLPPGGKLVYTEPAEAFLLQMKMAALAGLILSAPLILTQLWLFIAPGLYSHEKKFAIPFVVLSTLCFVGGALFSHYMVFPWAWRFFASFSTDYMEFLPRIGPVFSLYTRLLLAFGVIFQLPTLVFFLARMGMVTARFLIRNIKYAVLIVFIVAAVLTPTPDVVTQTLMAGPMLGLYLISIVIAWAFGKRRTPEP